MDVLLVAAIGSITARLNVLAAYFADLLAAALVEAKLFKSNTVITPNTLLSELSEADFSGYAPIVIAALEGPYLDGNGGAWGATALLQWTHSGGAVGNSIFSIGLVQSTGAAATATGTQSGGAVNAITVTAGGADYLLPPRVTITDATIGTGATAHAVLTAGVVTSIVIDTGGTGYTGPIIAIERPVRLIQGANFTQSQPMTNATQGILSIMEIKQTQ